MAKIHISGKNSKLGMIPNISLRPGTTCSVEACETCGVCWGLAKRGIDVCFKKH